MTNSCVARTVLGYAICVGSLLAAALSHGAPAAQSVDLSEVRQLIDQGKIATAIPLLESLEYANKRDARVIRLHGAALQAVGKVDRAIEKYEDVIRLDGYTTGMLLRIASCYNSLGQYDKSLSCVYKAQLVSTPRELGRCLALGAATVALMHEDEDLIVAAWTDAIERGCEDSVCWVARGAAYLQQEKFEEAIADLSFAIASESRHANAYLLRANAYARTGRYNDALTDIRAARRDFPDDLDVATFVAGFFSKSPVRPNQQDKELAQSAARMVHAKLQNMESAKLLADTLFATGGPGQAESFLLELSTSEAWERHKDAIDVALSDLGQGKRPFRK